MKLPTLIGLSALFCAGTAAAQSSVMIFGVVDATVSRYQTRSSLTAGPTTAAGILQVPGSLKQSATKLSSSGYNASRLGFRGTEDLGGGLAASFWLEAAITNDDGAKAINNFNRRSTVSLSGPFGEVRLGRDYTPSYWNDAVFDPFGNLGVGSSIVQGVSTLIWGAHGSPANGIAGGDNYVRASNSIGYFLPKVLGGVYGQAQYALHENVKQTSVVGSPSRNGRYVGARIGYAEGPLDIAVGYGEDTKDGSPLGFEVDRLKTVNLGASYDFGAVKVFGELSRVRDEDTDILAPNGAVLPLQVRQTGDYKGALIGLTAPIGAGLIRASYSRVKYDAPDRPGLAGAPGFAGGNDATAEKLAIGYVYNLSKRTAVYASVARVNLKWNGTVNPYMAAAVGGGVAYTARLNGINASYAPKSAVGYDFGIRHAF